MRLTVTVSVPDSGCRGCDFLDYDDPSRVPVWTCRLFRRNLVVSTEGHIFTAGRCQECVDALKDYERKGQAEYAQRQEG